MTFHNKNEMEVQRSKVNFDVHAVDTFVHELRARANTGGSNSAVLGCSLAQSQVRAPVEANYARRRRGRHRVKSLCKNFVHILVIKYNVMTA